MNNNVLSSIFVGLGLLAGCASAPWLSGSAGETSLTVRANVQDGALAYHVQTAPTPYYYTSTSINHVVLKLYTLDSLSSASIVTSNGSPVQADIASALLSQTVTFNNLHNNTSYRIMAFAYKDSSTATDSLISSSDSGSYRDVVLTTNLAPSITNVPVKLIDRLFAATATSGIVVTNGGVSNVDEVITAPTPTPLPG